MDPSGTSCDASEPRDVITGWIESVVADKSRERERLIASEDWLGCKETTDRIGAIQNERDEVLGKYEKNGQSVTEDMVDGLLSVSGIKHEDPLSAALLALITTCAPDAKRRVSECLECLANSFKNALDIQHALLLGNQDFFPLQNHFLVF